MSEQVFVTRERELAQLQTHFDRALAGQGTVCFVTGEAGAGKTALVTEFARRAQTQHDGLLVAIGNCNAQTGIGDPYLPFREVLCMFTGDVGAKLAQGIIHPGERRPAARFPARLWSGAGGVRAGPDRHLRAWRGSGNTSGRQRRHALGGSGAYTRRPVKRPRRTIIEKWQRACQVTH